MAERSKACHASCAGPTPSQHRPTSFSKARVVQRDRPGEWQHRRRVAPSRRSTVLRVGFTIAGGKIVEMDILADPERLNRLDLLGRSNPGEVRLTPDTTTLTAPGTSNWRRRRRRRRRRRPKPIKNFFFFFLF